MPTHSPLRLTNLESPACTVSLRLSILQQTPFCRGLSASEVAAINPLFREVGYAAGESVYFAGDAANHLYVVATGTVKVLRHSVSGDDVLLDVLVPGEFFGTLSAFGDDRYADTAQAYTDCCVLMITANDFQQILQTYASVALVLLELVIARLHETRERVRMLSTEPVPRRIAATLLTLSEKLGNTTPEGVLIQVPLSRQDLADMTGATLETVSRIMSTFRQAGFIRSGRRWVTILDLRGLAALSALDSRSSSGTLPPP